jgi:hypothetical protein
MPDQPDTARRLSVQHTDALWDAIVIPGPRTPTFTEQHQRVCEAVADILAEMTPATVAPPADRAALSAKLWEIAEHHIIAEWICCEPLEPRHDLCAKGYAALSMAKTLLVDGDPEEVWNPAAPLLDAVIDLLPAPVDRAAVLRDAAAEFERHVAQILEGVGDKAAFVAKALRDQAAVWSEAAETLRRMAGEAPATEEQGRG